LEREILANKVVQIWTRTDLSIVLNTVPSYDDIISAHVSFIANNQQAGKDTSVGGAYVVYDNQMNAIST